MDNTLLLGTFVALFGMIGGAAIVMYMVYSICHLGDEKK